MDECGVGIDDVFAPESVDVREKEGPVPEVCDIDIEKDDNIVDVMVELAGASATPSLVGVTISCDVKTTDVIRTMLGLLLNDADAAGDGSKSVATWKAFELDVAAEEELGEGDAEGLLTAVEEVVGSVVATSVSSGSPLWP